MRAFTENGILYQEIDPVDVSDVYVEDGHIIFARDCDDGFIRLKIPVEEWVFPDGGEYVLLFRDSDQRDLLG